jgi:hypothetical protein
LTLFVLQWSKLASYGAEPLTDLIDRTFNPNPGERRHQLR